MKIKAVISEPVNEFFARRKKILGGRTAWVNQTGPPAPWVFDSGLFGLAIAG